MLILLVKGVVGEDVVEEEEDDDDDDEPPPAICFNELPFVDEESVELLPPMVLVPLLIAGEEEFGELPFELLIIILLLLLLLLFVLLLLFILKLDVVIELDEVERPLVEPLFDDELILSEMLIPRRSRFDRLVMV